MVDEQNITEGTESGPAMESQEEEWNPILDENTVAVTAADYNGESFDGTPFSPYRKWVYDAITAGRIVLKGSRETDYAVWFVPEDSSRAYPGDIIRRDSETGTLSVEKHPSNLQ